MGCCLSSTGKSFKSTSMPHNQCHSVAAKARATKSGYSHVKLDEGLGSRAPPPLDEESVKEVLSETSKLKPPSLPPTPPIGPLLPDNKSGKLSSDLEKVSIQPTEEISEVSELCSFSESLSTTTITDKMDDYEEIRQRVCRSPAKLPKNRSFSDDWGPKRERLVGKSPTRKYEQSPVRRNGGAGTARFAQSRDMAQGQGIARRALRPEPLQQNKRENSYRRSRSPATTRADGVTFRTAVGRNPSVRRSGMSPGREDVNRKKALQHDKPEGNGPTTNESLDNPLVSLECFIFL